MSRPEHIAPPEVFYDSKEAAKYTRNSRVISIQTSMAERCLELLNFPPGEPRLVLDIGCGSGLSGDVLTEAGHAWLGMDISRDMLEVASSRGCLEDGDLLQQDIGQGFGFRAGMFDGAVSVSALQWLCYSDKKDHRSAKRLDTFFTSLYRCLRRGARAALQLYPETAEQLELITTAALRCGFQGGLVVDYPHSTKAKKFYLCIFAGVDKATAAASMPAALQAGQSRHVSSRGGAGAGGAGEMGESEDDDDDDDEDDDEDDEDDDDFDDGMTDGSGMRSKAGVSVSGGGSGGGDELRSAAAGGTWTDPGVSAGSAYPGEKAVHLRGRHRRERVKVKSRQWVLDKKSTQRRRGKEVRPDSKYTGRKRKPRF